ncbi:LPS export ABC transporter periplasmic protein LptC [Anaerohalosphaera lusitana]|nr:LPS export ABC transporter periplasmic protein LptC [Anaerohalosphaera lusitana]
MLRKLFIFGLTFAAVVLVFLALTRLTGTPQIDPTATTGDEEIEVPDFDNQSGQIGDVKVAPIELSRFVRRDDVTGDIARIFGYQEIRNPAEGKDRWRVVSPYMQVFGDKFTCNIDAERGNVELETIAGRPTPGDAQLSGNVQIKITPKPGSSMPETTVYLDVLDYYSERSEFSTDGPVKIVSSQGEMAGHGMVLIYNARQARIEDLRIRDLDYLRISRPAEAGSGDESSQEQQVADAGDEQVKQADEQVKEPVAARVETGKSGSETAAGKTNDKHANVSEEPEQKSKQDATSYLCRFLKDVNVRYGDRLKVSNANEMKIVNLAMLDSAGNQQSVDAEDDAGGAVVEESSDSKIITKNPADIKSGTETANHVTDEKPTDNGGQVVASAQHSASEDILITCSGGVVVTPIDKLPVDQKPVSDDRLLVLTGEPVRVSELASEGDKQGETIATCGQIAYDIDEDVLDLTAGPSEKYATLTMAGAAAGLHTEGMVKYRRNDNTATITGPGRLWQAGTEDESGQSNGATLEFDDTMDLAFIDAGDDSEADMLLASAKITGGVAATTEKDDSIMSAENADFIFDADSSIERADLSRSVTFSDPNGRLSCEYASIFFEIDDLGDPYAVSLTSSGEPVLEMIPEEDSEPAKIISSKLDYDIVNGNAVASGPVECHFFMPADEQAEAVAEPIPIIITSSKDAKYFAAGSAEFNGDVVAKSEKTADGVLQESSVYGDRLEVAFDPDEQAQSDAIVRTVDVTGESVRLESIRSQQEQKLSHIRLNCDSFHYDATEEIVLAEGPGEIEVDNSNAPVAAKDQEADSSGGPDLSGPCFASISGFEKLEWFIDDARVIADGGDEQVNIGYIPVTDGKPGPRTLASASEVRVQFKPSPVNQNKFDLSRLLALGGVYYEEADGNVFAGSELVYDTAEGYMVFDGSEDNPCFANGARVPRVKYDLETGEVDTSISFTPGSIDASRPEGQ